MGGYSGDETFKIGALERIIREKRLLVEGPLTHSPVD